MAKAKLPALSVFNIGGLNLQLNPLSIQPNELIKSVNVETYEFGAKKKRAGYTTFLGTADGEQVNSLLGFQKNDGTSHWLYRASGSALYNWDVGVGTAIVWSLCGNGTITDGNHVRGAILEDTLVVGDGASATRHTTDGTAFTNTTAAPVAVDFLEYQQRMYALGTASNLFYSTTGTATDWTTDSSSVLIPGEGRLLKGFKTGDTLIATKNSGLMFAYDSTNLIDMATNLGPTSADSVGEIEGLRVGLNRLGIFVYGAGMPELISNKIQKQIYNDAGEGIAGTIFDTAPGEVHRYDYYLSAGTVTDDLTDETIDNCIIKYNFQLNEFTNYKFAHFPTAWKSYKDKNGDQQLIFGDSTGQCYTFGGSSTTDNGETIEAEMQFVVHLSTLREKEWKWFRALFNPGCQAKVAIATTNTFSKSAKKWQDLGDASSGVVEYHFPQGSRSVFLFIKIYEASRNTRFRFFGYELEATAIGR